MNKSVLFSISGNVAIGKALNYNINIWLKNLRIKGKMAFLHVAGGISFFLIPLF